MKHFILTIAVIVFGYSFSEAQDYKYGKVSKAELEEQFYPMDSSANAVMLFKKEYIHFVITKEGFTQLREVHERIKIYDKEGFDWATKKIYLYQGGGGKNEKILGLKGATYNLVDGKIVKDKLKKDGIFEEDFNEFTEINTITLPNVKEDAIIEYKYTISSPFLQIDDMQLQYTIPIKKMDVEISTPEELRYNKLLNPKAAFMPKVKEKRIQRTSAVNIYDPGAMKFHDDVIEILEQDVPAVKAEVFAGNINNYRSKLVMELSAIMNDRGGVVRSFSTSWEKVCQNIYENSDFGNQMKRSGFFKDDIAPIMAETTNDFQKISALYNLVKSKVKWNGIYGYRALKGTRSAYKEGEGNIADINLLLIAMLRSQGINANPVLISTKEHGVPLYPTRKGFNYIICLVQIDEDYFLLDASESYSTINVLPQRVLHWQGRVLMDNGNSEWISLTPNKSVESTSLNVKINEDYTLSGTVRKNMTNHIALRYRKRYANRGKDDHIKELESDRGDIVVSELNFENAKNVMKPVKLNYQYQLTDGIDDIGNKLYFSPLLFLTTKESPFKLDKRYYPIDFVMPFEDKYIVNIMLPEGYKLEYMPKSEILEFKSGQARFSYLAKENGKYLQLSIILDINTVIINPEDYTMFKNFFEKIVEKQLEQIVLIKV